MRFLIPKTRWAVLRRALVAVVLVVGLTAAATATAVLLQVKTFVGDVNRSPPITSKQVVVPSPGAPQTILLIGADKRLHGGEAPGKIGNTDTMMLVRVNDSSQTINVLSIPRDLMVQLPGVGTAKLNAAYNDGGPDLLIKTIKQQVFPDMNFNVDQIMVVSFLGFAHLINDIGCVYGEVDQRYYNHNDPAYDNIEEYPDYPDNFSDINLQPGYQKMCGQAGGAKSALAFVRYRHTDTDQVRNARQQDFLRWAKGQFSVDYLIDKYGKLATEFGKNVQLDNDLHTEDGLLNMFHVLINADGHQIKSITFPEADETYGGHDYVVPTTTEAEHAAYREFMTPTVKKTVSKKSKKKKKRHHHHRHVFKLTSGLVADPTDGKTQASDLGDPGIPIYYPKYIPNNYGYCFAANTGSAMLNQNCDESALEPSSAYNGSYPRRYEVTGPAGRKYKAWVMTLLAGANSADPSLASGEYFNVQGLQWKNPPLLKDPTKTEMVNGKKLLIFSQGGKVSTVAWRKSHAVYWIQNTLTNSIPNKQMIDMAATLTPYPSSLKHEMSKSNGASRKRLHTSR